MRTNVITINPCPKFKVAGWYVSPLYPYNSPLTVFPTKAKAIAYASTLPDECAQVTVDWTKSRDDKRDLREVLSKTRPIVQGD